MSSTLRGDPPSAEERRDHPCLGRDKRRHGAREPDPDRVLRRDVAEPRAAAVAYRRDRIFEEQPGHRRIEEEVAEAAEIGRREPVEEDRGIAAEPVSPALLL
jgi:hypothetical protein